MYSIFGTPRQDSEHEQDRMKYWSSVTVCGAPYKSRTQFIMQWRYLAGGATPAPDCIINLLRLNVVTYSTHSNSVTLVLVCPTYNNNGDTSVLQSKLGGSICSLCLGGNWMRTCAWLCILEVW